MFNNIKFKKKTLSEWVEMLVNGQSRLKEDVEATKHRIGELAHATDGNSAQGYASDANQMEYYAEILRMQGQSGVCNVIMCVLVTMITDYVKISQRAPAS